MPVNWRVPHGKFVIPIQAHFFQIGYTTTPEMLERGEAIDPYQGVVYASEREVAREIGIDTYRLDTLQREQGALVHAIDEAEYGKVEVFEKVFPENLVHSFFLATVSGRRHVYCPDSVLAYEPPA